jgi:hypothetical protein
MREKLMKEFEIAEAETEAGTEMDSLAGRFLCIRVCGFLEQSMLTCSRALCERSSWGEGQEFALSHLEKSRNPKSERLIEHVRRFNASWADELDEFMSEDETANRIDSLVGIRNQIAHGRSQGIGRVSSFEYFGVVDKVVDWIVDRFDPA